MQLSDKPARSQSREVITQQLEQETAQRLSQIDSEFADGYQLVNKYNDTITVFGSARFKESHPYYKKAVEITGALSRQGYTIVTGGGPGIMEAANRGAFEADCPSVGVGIELPNEQSLNPYITDSLMFRHFFARKVMLAFGANGCLYFPGGFGTLDELFEIITLIQTGKMPIVPIILIGNHFWGELDKFITDQLLEGTHTISPGDEKLYTITEDLEVIISIMNKHRDQMWSTHKQKSQVHQL
jgi:uncharacterized protein (TIGR00730 family)